VKLSQIPEASITISAREDADEALEAIQSLKAYIVLKEQLATDKIGEIKDQLILDTAEERADLINLEDALEDWASADRKNWTAKHVELNFGTVGFRIPKAAIKLTLGAKTILERLRARKMRAASARPRRSIRKRSPATATTF
jgi:phage host-nuclease inhibitor protein Gam